MIKLTSSDCHTYQYFVKEASTELTAAEDTYPMFRVIAALLSINQVEARCKASDRTDMHVA
jgi:hypothetical protein